MTENLKCISIFKMINRRDGKGQDKKEMVIEPPQISEKEPQIVCSECKVLGIRTTSWKGDLYACKNIECDVRWYWQKGVYYV